MININANKQRIKKKKTHNWEAFPASRFLLFYRKKKIKNCM